MINKEVGKQIRNQRREKKITLSELSKQTNLSVGYLSNLENNLSNPRLDDIHKICEVLEISLIELLSYEPFQEDRFIIRKGNREIIYKENGKVIYELIGYGRNHLEGLLIKIDPNCHFKTNWHHDYDEIGLVLKGQLVITIEDKDYTLYKGDSFYIKAQLEHSLKNNSDIVCESYWVKNPSTF